MCGTTAGAVSGAMLDRGERAVQGSLIYWCCADVFRPWKHLNSTELVLPSLGSLVFDTSSGRDC